MARRPVIIDLPGTTTSAINQSAGRAARERGRRRARPGAHAGHRHRRRRRRGGDRGRQRRQPRAPLPGAGRRRRYQARRLAARRPGPRGRRRRRQRGRSSCGCTASSRATPTAWSCRCCCPTRRSSPGGRRDAAGRPLAGPGRRDGAAPHHRRLAGPRDPRPRSSGSPACHARATPTWPGPASRGGARCWPAALDQPPFEPVTARRGHRGVRLPELRPARRLARVVGCAARCSAGAPRAGGGMTGVRLERASGDVELVRPDGNVATLTPARAARAAGGPGPARHRRVPRRGAAPARPGRRSTPTCSPGAAAAHPHPARTTVQVEAEAPRPRPRAAACPPRPSPAAP